MNEPAATKTKCRCTIACPMHKNARAAWDVVEQVAQLLEKAFQSNGTDGFAAIPCSSILASQIVSTWKARE